MKHFETVQQPCIKADQKTACGECQASCQSACKTSCTVANQKCAKEEKQRLTTLARKAFSGLSFSVCEE